MRSSGHLLRRAGREFLRNLIWMAVVFGSPAVILAAVTDLYLVGVSSFVGASVTVLTALVTVGALWSGAPTDEPPLGGHDYPGSHPDGAGHWPVGGWDGGGGDGGGEAYKAAFAAVRNDP